MKRTEAVEVKEPLLQVAVVQVSIHIQTGEGPFNRIDLPVLIAIQLLKMVVGQIRRLRILDAGRAVIETRIVPLRIFKQAVMRKVLSWLYHGLGRMLLMDVDPPMALLSRRLDL